MSPDKDKSGKDIYQRALEAYSQAMKTFRKGDLSKATTQLEDFIAKYSSEKELADRARLYLTICKQRMEKSSLPLKTYEDYLQYGVYLLNTGEYEEALKLFQQAAEINPEGGKVFYLMANAYCLLGEEDACMENLKKAIHLDKFYKILAQNEVGFEPLREDKKFKLITKMA